MKKIGIYDDVLKVSILNRDGFWFRTPYSKSNEVLATLKMGKMPKGEMRYDFAAANLGQDDLAELILAHAEKLDNFSILWSHHFAGVKQDVHGTTLCAATPKGEVFLNADYVIGCDGASSAVRRCLCIPFEGFTWDVSPLRKMSKWIGLPFHCNEY
jgi:2-polyprenyl-6-methoxyphenol hydroxylase-like FAD-dependent oxidoreductase